MYDVWKNVLAEIEQKVSPDNFSTWIKDTSLISIEDGVVKISVRNSFYVKQLRSRYFDKFSSALKNNGVEFNDIEFIVQSDSKAKVKPHEVINGSEKVRERVKSLKSSKPLSGYENGLNEKYTLDNFIVGSNNDLAVSAAKSIIDSPGTRYNPFFLYGGPGLGKTHLV